MALSPPQISPNFMPVLRSRRPATGVSRALRARVFWGVSPRVSPKTGVSDGVSHGALRVPGSGVSNKSPESVSGVSKRCSRHSGDTLGTLFRHSGAWGPKGPRTLRGTPPFSGHSRGHSMGHWGPKGPRDPVAGRQDRNASTGNDFCEPSLAFSRKITASTGSCRCCAPMRQHE